MLTNEQLTELAEPFWLKDAQKEGEFFDVNGFSRALLAAAKPVSTLTREEKEIREFDDVERAAKPVSAVDWKKEAEYWRNKCLETTDVDPHEPALSESDEIETPQGRSIMQMWYDSGRDVFVFYDRIKRELDEAKPVSVPQGLIELVVREACDAYSKGGSAGVIESAVRAAFNAYVPVSVDAAFPYQKTFNAIAAATHISAGGIAISVKAFINEFCGDSTPPTESTGEPQS